MPDRDKVLAVVRGWVTKAENDLKNAAQVLKLKKRCPTDTVCFHAQQCAEKYIKAVLVLKGIDFPGTHDLEKLTALLPVRTHLNLSAKEQGRLTEYATVARYPGWGEIPLAEARRAVAIARRVRAALRKVFPKEALRPRK